MIISVLVPSLVLDAPVKGAVALANELSNTQRVILVCLKISKRENVSALKINPKVEILHLGSAKTWGGKLLLYRKHLRGSGNRINNVSISYCLSADVFNFFMKRYSRLVSSIRGNLPSNYRISYGFIGGLIALLQFSLLRRFDHVFAMSKSMEKQLKEYGLRRVSIIGNFIDEASLSNQCLNTNDNCGGARFVYVGRLVSLKRPQIVLECIYRLRKKGINCQLDILGDGPLYGELTNMIVKYDLINHVTMHGCLEEPYSIIQKSDFFVLPSVSEGTSRAVLEALFFGVPCVIRKVDAAAELVESGVNGELFVDDDDFFQVIERLATDIVYYRTVYPKKNYLPNKYRQARNVNKLLDILSQDT